MPRTGSGTPFGKDRLSAVDMRLTPKEKYVFPELNPAGQWLFVDPASQAAITAELAHLHVEGDTREREQPST
jgi:hypothetical protein